MKTRFCNEAKNRHDILAVILGVPRFAGRAFRSSALTALHCPARGATACAATTIPNAFFAKFYYRKKNELSKEGCAEGVTALYFFACINCKSDCLSLSTETDVADRIGCRWSLPLDEIKPIRGLSVLLTKHTSGK